MQTYTNSGGGRGSALPCSWHVQSGRLSPEFILGIFIAQTLPSEPELKAFECNGIPAQALRTPISIRIGRVAFSASGCEIEPYYCSTGESEPAYLFLVADSHGDACDIAAWTPDSGRLATWLGRAWALGQETTLCPRLTDHQGLHIWRSPWGWLRANREGIVPIRAGALPFQLECAGPLVAEDVAHGIELREQLTPTPPRILVPKSGRIE